MDYKIISSGSSGNCVTINKDVMIDCGLGFTKIKENLYDVKYLIITHIHSDHLKMKTFDMIRKLFPRIHVIGNFEVAQTVNVDTIANEGFEIAFDDYTFFPFRCPHGGVVCYGYTWEIGDQSIIYATDTSTLEHAPSGPYDWFFIESNHDEKKLEEVRNKKNSGYDPYESGKRHLSTQQCRAFYYMNRRTKNSKLIELHKSQRFY
jgi:phosphoribosyl 1,2-cyclic phosphodiesterase